MPKIDLPLSSKYAYDVVILSTQRRPSDCSLVHLDLQINQKKITLAVTLVSRIRATKIVSLWKNSRLKRAPSKTTRFQILSITSDCKSCLLKLCMHFVSPQPISCHPGLSTLYACHHHHAVHMSKQNPFHQARSCLNHEYVCNLGLRTVYHYQSLDFDCELRRETILTSKEGFNHRSNLASKLTQLRPPFPRTMYTSNPESNTRLWRV